MRPSPGLLAGGAVALTVLVAAVVGAPMLWHSSPAGEPGSVSANGITLVSQSITLPDDDGQYPAGPGADLVNANCAACHSPSMALSQPPLSADQWKAEVTKMREAYHAPIDEKDVPAIVAYLTALPGQKLAAK